MAIHKLTVKGLEALPAGKYGDGAGLWIIKRSKEQGSWFLRYTIRGKRREMGLGPYLDVSLTQARELAGKWRSLAKAGKDPIAERARERREDEKKRKLLRDVALETLESRKAELKGEGKAGGWFSPLELHVLPKLGDKPVVDITQDNIVATLGPIWHSKAETARKAMGRLSIVIKHAAALGLDVDVQAVGKAKALLGAQRHKVKHIPAMSWQEVPAYYETLDHGSVPHLALRLLILTGARTSAIRFAKLDQFEGDVWTVPAENMKGRHGKTKDFRIPMSAEALAVVEEAKAHERNDWLFVAARGRSPISDMTMSQMMKRQGHEARPHGFRTSLRVWLAECTDAPHEVAETVLAHVSGSQVVDAYRRTDFLDQRRVLMARWADHVAGGAGQVVSLHG